MRGCEHCAAHLPHGTRPVLTAGRGARIVIVGQAPGSKVHASGVPWDDESGARLRDWLQIPHEVFYDPEQVCILPMGFCYPGKGSSGDLPPRPECAPLWHDAVLQHLPEAQLTLLVGMWAQKRYFQGRKSMTARVEAWREDLPLRLALPHPAWRSRLWMKKHPWFEAEVVPALRTRVSDILAT